MMINFNDLTLEEQIMCIENTRQKEMEKILNSTYNPKQIKLNLMVINTYYNRIIKEVSKNYYKTNNEEELRKVA